MPAQEPQTLLHFDVSIVSKMFTLVKVVLLAMVILSEDITSKLIPEVVPTTFGLVRFLMSNPYYLLLLVNNP